MSARALRQHALAPAVRVAVDPLILPVDDQLIARLALRALYKELCVYPKPGLVSLIDPGSHADMDGATFVRSLFSLRHYFRAIARAGAQGVAFPVLQSLGLQAEQRMLAATDGVNTHRGAIFALGLLVAAAGHATRIANAPDAIPLGQVVKTRWAAAIMHAESGAPSSHGLLVARRYGVAGARAEACAGFPHVFRVGLPAFRDALTRTGDANRAAVQTFFSLMARLDDTNVLYRGGRAGLQYARSAAEAFLAAGGVYHRHWRRQVLSLHHEFVARRLSPGGSADLLAATLFAFEWERLPRA